MFHLGEVPGASVFRGENDIFIDNSAPVLEEEEFLEEEKNRQFELQNAMKTAFGDLEEDDTNSSISSHFSSRHNYQTGHSYDRINDCNGESLHENGGNVSYDGGGQSSGTTTSRKHRWRKPSKEGQDVSACETPFSSDPPVLDQNNVRLSSEDATAAYKHAGVNGAQQLQIMLGLRVKEIAQLRSEIACEKESKHQVLRRLTISEEEKQEMGTLLSDLKTLYSECSEKLKTANQEVASLQEELNRARQTKDETKHELDIAKLQILQQEQQIALMEKCGNLKNQDKYIDSVVEKLKEMHKREMGAVRKELDDALTKLRHKEDSCQVLENKLVEVEEKRIGMLLNKCDSTVQQEAAVKALLDDAQQQNFQLSKNIRALEAENSSLRRDLEFHENMTTNRLMSSTSSGEHEMDMRSPSSVRHFGEKKSINNVDILKAELNRALLGQKDKRMEIRKLHEKIQAKEVQITQMREQEKMRYSEAEALKANMASLMQRFEKGADESEKMELTEKIDRLEQLISALSKEKSEQEVHSQKLENEVKSLKLQLLEQEALSRKVAEEYMVFHEQEIERLKEQHQEMFNTNEHEYRNRLQRLSNDCDEIKKLYLEMRSARDLIAEQLEDERNKVMEYMRTNKALEERIKSLKKQVSDLEDHIIGIQEERNEVRHGERQSSEEKSVDGFFVRRLKNEIELLRRQTIDPTELEKLRDEVSEAKKRYLDLEKTLKTDFETNVTELKKENEHLKASLHKYNQRVDAFCDAETQTLVVVPKVSSADLIRGDGLEKLQSELERLRILEENHCKEILDLKTTFQKRLQEKLEELEPKLMYQSFCGTESVKEEVKRITSQFYIVEMEKLRAAHKQELEEFETLKEEQSTKIRRLESELQSRLNEVQAVEELKAQLIAQQNAIQEVKTKSSLIIRNCSKEYEELKMAKQELEEKLTALAAKTEKYKQSAFKYKKLFEKIKMNDLPQRYQRLVALVESKELEIVNKIQEAAKAYESQQNQASDR